MKWRNTNEKGIVILTAHATPNHHGQQQRDRVRGRGPSWSEADGRPQPSFSFKKITDCHTFFDFF